MQDEGSQLVALLTDARPRHAGRRPLRRRRRQDPGAGRGHGEQRRAGRPRQGRAPARAGPASPAEGRRDGGGTAPAPRPGGHLVGRIRRRFRPGAGGRALFRLRRLAAQPGCPLAPERGCPRAPPKQPGGDPRPGRHPGRAWRPPGSMPPARCSTRRTAIKSRASWSRTPISTCSRSRGCGTRFWAATVRRRGRSCC